LGFRGEGLRFRGVGLNVKGESVMFIVQVRVFRVQCSGSVEEYGSSFRFQGLGVRVRFLDCRFLFRVHSSEVEGLRFRV